MFTISLFRSIENKHDPYREKYSMKKEFQNEGKLMSKEQKESYENAKICHICKGKFENEYVREKRKNIVMLEIIL